MIKKIIANIERWDKNSLILRDVLFHFLYNGYDTIGNIAKAQNLSVPTVKKFLDEMTLAGLITETGKREYGGGRHPVVYGLNATACYFGGVDIRNTTVSMVISDLCGQVIFSQDNIPYTAVDTPESLDQLCDHINAFLNASPVPRNEILKIGINISGRVDSKRGYSYNFFNFYNNPLDEILTQKVGARCCIENDTRAMALGEYIYSKPEGARNILFINVNWGIGIGFIFDGKLYSGKSGFAGEIGHMVTYNNEIICHCGKKGCLETEASGSALMRKLYKRLDAGANSLIAEHYRSTGNVTLDDVLQAALHEDVLCLELIEEMAGELGRWLAGLLNIFNPDLVVVGGMLSETGDCLLQPISVSLRRYALNMVYKDTEIKLSKLGRTAGVLGACTKARFKAFEEIFDKKIHK